MSTVLHRSAPLCWTVITLAGSDHDAWVSHAARGFPGPNFFNKIRRRPMVKRMLKHLVFLPLDLAMPAAERERMIDRVLNSDAVAPSWYVWF